MRRSPALADRSPYLACHDHVTEETQASDRGGSLDVLRGSAVGLTGFGVAVRVVVGKSERSTVVAEHSVEDLTHGNQRAID